ASRARTQAATSASDGQGPSSGAASCSARRVARAVAAIASSRATLPPLRLELGVGAGDLVALGVELDDLGADGLRLVFGLAGGGLVGDGRPGAAAGGRPLPRLAGHGCHGFAPSYGDRSGMALPAAYFRGPPVLRRSRPVADSLPGSAKPSCRATAP